MKKRKPLFHCIALGLLLSVYIFAKTQIKAAHNMNMMLVDYTISIMLILFPALVMIGLFEVWVNGKTVEKHLGTGAGVRAYCYALLLGMFTVGPLIISLPMAYSLHRKGAALSIVLTYLGAASTLRIPMTLFEISFMGIFFSIIRIVTASVLIIGSSYIIGRIMSKGKSGIPELD